MDLSLINLIHTENLIAIICYLVGVFVFIYYFIKIANRNNLKWIGLVVDSDGKSVSRAGLIAWVLFFLQVYFWLTGRDSPMGLTEAFGFSLLFLLGSKASSVGKRFFKEKMANQKLQIELEHNKEPCESEEEESEEEIVRIPRAEDEENEENK